MKYTENGIEVQYRECQILRDTAKNLLNNVEDQKNEQTLVKQKADWIHEINKLSKDKQKGRYSESLSRILCHMDEENYLGLVEYIIFLIKKEKGIDIMVPYITQNKVLILPVNLHE